MQVSFADPLSGLDDLNQATSLVGRENEMQVIRVLLNTVLLDLSGAHALNISGETGVGKSRLLAEMYREARTLGFQVLEGYAYETSNMVPYLPIIEALRSVFRFSSLERLRQYVGIEGYGEDEVQQRADDNISLIGAPLVTSLSRILPEIPKLLNVNVMPEIISPDQEKFRFLDAVATLLERMAQDQPVLLGIDNLQWADSATLELILYLTVRLHRSRVALVGATRPPTMPLEHEEDSVRVDTPTMNNAATRALMELISKGLLLLLPLAPLDSRAAAEHLHTLLPGSVPENIVEVLLARTEGNPFFLEELVRGLVLQRQIVLNNGVWQATKSVGAALPQSITLAVGQRLQGASTVCREVLRVAALFGRTFSANALARVLEGTEYSAAIVSSLDEARNASLIAMSSLVEQDQDEYGDEVDQLIGQAAPLAGSEPVSYLFCQGIVQEVLSAEVPVHSIRGLHRDIGAALEEEYKQSASAHAAELARHYMLGGDKAATLRWSLLAGQHAASQQAYREAIGHFRTVLRLVTAGERSDQAPSQAQLHATIGELWFKLAELEQAATSFQEAIRLYPIEQTSQHDRKASLQFAQTYRLAADVYRMQAKYDQALAYLQTAKAALDAETDVEANTNGQTTLSQEQEVQVPWFPGRSITGSGPLLTLERASLSERVLMLQAQAMLDIFFHRKAEAEASLWRSHQLAVQAGDRESQAFALHLIGWLRGWGIHIREAIRLQEQARELYIELGDPLRASLGDQGLGCIYQALGEMERAHFYTSQGLKRALRYGARFNLGWLYWNLGTIALVCGDWSESEKNLQEAWRETEATNNVRLAPLVLQAQAELTMRYGDWHRAEDYFQRSIEAAANTEWYPGSLALYGHFLAVTGRRTEARPQLDKAAAYPEPPGFGGDFYIPFLAEGYLHLEANEQARTFIDRIQNQRGFMYYGSSVDRILGVVAMQAGDWAMMERAFDDGLRLCRRAGNEPEVGAILYEQARAIVMQSATL